MVAVAIIPARLGSSRFPGKPLAPILGMPMIGHCYLRTQMSKQLHSTWVATCDQEIFDYVESIGGKAVMTADTHERAADRTAEAMLKIEQSIGQRIDIAVMVQGDEPLVTPEMIDDSIVALNEAPDADVACLMGRIEDLEGFGDRNEVKVVVDRQGYALYFSREPIPSPYRGQDVSKHMLKQVCIIPFRRDYLLKFLKLEQTALEIIESVDLNRCLEYGHKVKMALTEHPTVSVDTEQDRQDAEDALRSDKLVASYLKQPA